MSAPEQKITPLLWFDSDAEEAVNFYVSIFKGGKIDKISRYGDAGPGPKGAAMMIEFQLEGQPFLALNGFAASDAAPMDAPPRGGIALYVDCETQAEVDTLWDRLLEGGEPSQCGWLRDRYGFMWNIVPKGLSEVLGQNDPVKRERAMKAMLKMVKLDIDALRRASESESTNA